MKKLFTKFCTFSICFIFLGHSVKGNETSGFSVESLRKNLTELKIAIGDPFPSQCWPGYKEKYGENRPPEVKESITCIPDRPADGITSIHILRSGYLISSINMKLGLLPGKTCTSDLLHEIANSKKDKIKIENKYSKEQFTQISGLLEFATEQTLAITCSQEYEKTFASLELQTKYSLLGTIGKSVRTDVVVLSGLKEYSAEPYFIGYGNTPEEMLEDTEARIKKYWPRSVGFGTLARKLMNDDVMWARNRERINKNIEFQRQIFHEKQAKFLDDQKHRFLVGSKCYSDCFYGLRKSGPKCKAFHTASENVGKKDPTETKEQREKKIMEYFKSNPSKDCDKEISEGIKTYSATCLTTCPNTLKEAGLKEAENVLIHLKNKEVSYFKSHGTYTTDVAALGFDDSFIFVNKFGFVKAFGTRELPSNFYGTNPARMNTDYFIRVGLHNAPFEMGAKKTPFSIMEKYCPDCTASKTGFKAVAFSDAKGDGNFEVRTIDQTGKIEKILINSK